MKVSPPSRRAERRPVESRRAILDATESLLLEVGADRLSIRGVSRACGFQAPTIYHHFGDKQGLIDELLEERFRDLLPVFESVPRRLDAVAYLHELARVYVGMRDTHRDLYRLLTLPRPDDAAEPPSAARIRDMFSEALEQLARQGRLKADDIQAALQTVWAMMHGLVSLSISRPDYEWNDAVIDTALGALVRGLFAEEGTR